MIQRYFTFTKDFSTGLEDLELDITPLVEQWIAGTYSNYGIGVHLSASYEAYESGSANTVTSRIPGQLALDGDDTAHRVLFTTRADLLLHIIPRGFLVEEQNISLRNRPLRLDGTQPKPMIELTFSLVVL